MPIDPTQKIKSQDQASLYGARFGHILFNIYDPQLAFEALDTHQHTQQECVGGNGLSGQVGPTGTNYVAPYTGGLNNVNAVWPYTGVLNNFQFSTSSTQPASGSLVATLLVNGSPSALTITVAAGSGAGTFSDNVHTVNINAGDRIRWQFVNNATANSAQIQGVSMIAKANTNF